MPNEMSLRRMRKQRNQISARMVYNKHHATILRIGQTSTWKWERRSQMTTDARHTTLEEVRATARKHAKRAVTILARVMKDGNSTPAIRVTAALKLLEFAYGPALDRAPGHGTAVDDLLGALGTDKPPVNAPPPSETPKESENANQPNSGEGAGPA